MDVIKVDHLVKKYKEHAAVNDISFSVKEGELFAFLGENGAGKSTTINMLCTILEKTAGDVSICGHTLGKEDDEIRSLIGIVFQNSVLDNKLTVKENLYTRGSYYGLSRKEIESRMAPFSQQFEMDEIWNRRYEKLSGGQRRRVDIMRALIHNPRILFLDEPTTGLDPKSRKLVWDYIDYLRHEKGMTIFLTTHYMEETANADHVVILDKGKIISSGTPAELKSRHTSSRLVWYREKNAEAEEIIEQITEKNKGVTSQADEKTADTMRLSVSHYTYDADHYNVYFKGNITEFLYMHRDEVQDYEIIKGSMDDVFLNLTGKELES